MLEKLSLLKKANKVGINDVIKRIEIINNSLKPQIIKKDTDTENINPRVSNTINGKTMILSKCTASCSKKSRFIKNQEAKRLLSNLGLRTPLSKVPLLGHILF